MSDGEVDIRVLALRRQQRRNQVRSGTHFGENTTPPPDFNQKSYGRISSGHSAYESTPIKAFNGGGGMVSDSPCPTPQQRRNSYLGPLSASLFDEEARIGRMHVPPVIRCECNGIECFALISTSETVSTISMDFVKRLRLVDQVIPEQSQIFNPLSFNQPELKGKVKYVDLSIASWQQVAQFSIVENHVSDITLGIDFLRRTQSVVNFGESVLLVGGAKGERIHFLNSREVMGLAKRNTNRSTFRIANGFSESQ